MVALCKDWRCSSRRAWRAHGGCWLVQDPLRFCPRHDCSVHVPVTAWSNARALKPRCGGAPDPQVRPLILPPARLHGVLVSSGAAQASYYQPRSLRVQSEVTSGCAWILCGCYGSCPTAASVPVSPRLFHPISCIVHSASAPVQSPPMYFVPSRYRHSLHCVCEPTCLLLSRDWSGKTGKVQEKKKKVGPVAPVGCGACRAFLGRPWQAGLISGSLTDSRWEPRSVGA